MSACTSASDRSVLLRWVQVDGPTSSARTRPASSSTGDPTSPTAPADADGHACHGSTRGSTSIARQGARRPVDLRLHQVLVHDHLLVLAPIGVPEMGPYVHDAIAADRRHDVEGPQAPHGADGRRRDGVPPIRTRGDRGGRRTEGHRRHPVRSQQLDDDAAPGPTGAHVLLRLGPCGTVARHAEPALAQRRVARHEERAVEVLEHAEQQRPPSRLLRHRVDQRSAQPPADVAPLQHRSGLSRRAAGDRQDLPGRAVDDHDQVDLVDDLELSADLPVELAHVAGAHVRGHRVDEAAGVQQVGRGRAPHRARRELGRLLQRSPRSRRRLLVGRHRGSPQARWAMMLRWTSLVPA